MKLVSVSGLLYYVKDLDRTAEFYEALGFQIRERSESRLSVGLNWFWMDFHSIDKETTAEFQAEAKAEPKGSGLYVYVKVEAIDELYKALIAKGLKPSSEPRDWPWGNREFVIRDPDGYKLVFFQKS